MARLYREAPLNGIWEGSGNVICLDVLRAAARSPQSVPAFLDEVRLAKGADRRLDRMVDRLETELRDRDEHEARARRIVEKMAIALQASLLVRHSPLPWRMPSARRGSMATAGRRMAACRRPRPARHRRARARGRPMQDLKARSSSSPVAPPGSGAPLPWPSPGAARPS